MSWIPSTLMGDWDGFIDRLASKQATVAVVGLGYVGLPVAMSFVDAGFNVIGLDVAATRVTALQKGQSYLRDVPSERVAAAQATGRVKFTQSYEDLSKAEAVLICVPTPLLEGTPDISSIKAASQGLGRVLVSPVLVVLESTTYPGTTEEIVGPLLEDGVRKVGVDFLLAFSPERIDPGNQEYDFTDIPKIVGGSTPEATRAAEVLYGHVVPKVFTVPGTREAEMAKLIENTFRHVNIALVNELAVYAHELGIDIWESISAAATKPFGFMPFWPGPGWGGHCIPLDPAYLSWRVRKDRAHEVRFVELAHTVNSEMPRYVVERITLGLNDLGLAVKGARVLGVGIAYKGGTEDLRGSPGLKVLTMLKERGAVVDYHDPLVPSLVLGDTQVESIEPTSVALDGYDIVVALAKQDDVDWGELQRGSRLILDCCNAFPVDSEKVVRL